MRELTGYEDRHGRPILEGDLVASHAGEINVVEEIPEGWSRGAPQVEGEESGP
jgi:hypothetical protein